MREELASLHHSALAAADRPAELEDLCARAATTVRAAGVPAELAAAVQEAYAGLADGTGDGTDPIVAVRSSAVGEDAADTSFAGMNSTFTNVRGGQELLRRIVDCWASAFGPRVVAYRAARGFTGEPAIAVVVQVMVDAQRSGVAFTADPATGGVTSSMSKRHSDRARRWSAARSSRTPTSWRSPAHACCHCGSDASSISSCAGRRRRSHGAAGSGACRRPGSARRRGR